MLTRLAFVPFGRLGPSLVGHLQGLPVEIALLVPFRESSAVVR